MKATINFNVSINGLNHNEERHNICKYDDHDKTYNGGETTTLENFEVSVGCTTECTPDEFGELVRSLTIVVKDAIASKTVKTEEIKEKNIIS